MWRLPPAAVSSTRPESRCFASLPWGTNKRSSPCWPIRFLRAPASMVFSNWSSCGAEYSVLTFESRSSRCSDGLTVGTRPHSPLHRRRQPPSSAPGYRTELTDLRLLLLHRPGSIVQVTSGAMSSRRIVMTPSRHYRTSLLRRVLPASIESRPDREGRIKLGSWSAWQPASTPSTTGEASRRPAVGYTGVRSDAPTRPGTAGGRTRARATAAPGRVDGRFTHA